jgi:hypothetical protein
MRSEFSKCLSRNVYLETTFRDRRQHNAENLYLWVKWPLNLAVFVAAFCSLRTHARQGSNSGSLDTHSRRHTLGQGAHFGLSCLSPPLPLSLWISLSSNDLMDHRPILRRRPISVARWPLTHRLPRLPAEEHLTRSRNPSHGNPALQSQGG